MVERMKDAEDRLLESMFASQPVADDGFSNRIVSRINRRLWLRRLTLPIAALIGLVFAFKPLAGVVMALAAVASRLPQSLVDSTAGALPQTQVFVMGAVLLGAFLAAGRLIDE